MLLYINRAGHTAVPLKVSRGLPVLFFFAGGKVQTPPAVGFPIIINGKVYKFNKYTKNPR